MAIKSINRYFVDIRLSNESDNRHSLHIDACSRVGAIYQAVMMLKEYDIKDAYAIIVKKEAYPVAKRKRAKAIKEKNQKQALKKDNIKAINLIKSRLDAVASATVDQKGDSV